MNWPSCVSSEGFVSSSAVQTLVFLHYKDDCRETGARDRTATPEVQREPQTVWSPGPRETKVKRAGCLTWCSLTSDPGRALRGGRREPVSLRPKSCSLIFYQTTWSCVLKPPLLKVCESETDAFSFKSPEQPQSKKQHYCNVSVSCLCLSPLSPLCLVCPSPPVFDSVLSSSYSVYSRTLKVASPAVRPEFSHRDQ